MGYSTAWGMDINPSKLNPLSVFRKVHPHAVALEQDISDVRAAAAAIEGQGYVHAITVSSPCQGLSRANGHKDTHDVRNQLLEKSALVIARLKCPPDVVAYENVVGLLKSPYWRAVVTIITSLGYSLEVAEVEADYWVPQQRTRVMAVFTKGAASSRLTAATADLAGTPKVAMQAATGLRRGYYAYRRRQQDRCCMPPSTPHPCQRKNSGYRPRTGAYGARKPWARRGEGRRGEACGDERARSRTRRCSSD